MPGAIRQRLHRYLLDSSDENLRAQAATPGSVIHACWSR